MNIFIKRKLINCNPNTIGFFTFEGQTVNARMVDCYDGDTCTLIIPFMSTLIKIKCRLNRINTPELRTIDALEREIAIKARDKLQEYIDVILTAKFSKADKYGRFLVDLYTDNGKCINDMLVEENLACQYDGGTKKPFREWFNIKRLYYPQTKPSLLNRLFFCRC